VTAVRWANLLRRGAVSRQENDQYQAQYQAQFANVGALSHAVGAAVENVSAAQANLQRLVDLQKYEHVRAPFTGIVTNRNIDVGALISTGTTLLFRVAQIDNLRTYIYIPQANAPGIQVGQNASLLAVEFPGRRFGGRITRTADALDPATRTLLTEVQVPNPGHSLLPGMFVQVNLGGERKDPPLLVPGDSLIVQSTGTQLAVVERTNETAPVAQSPNQDAKQKDGKNQKPQDKPVYIVHLRKVEIGRDYGTQIEILTGLNDGQLVITNPTDDVREGAKVHIQASKENPSGAGSQPPAGGKRDLNSEQLQPKIGAEPRPNKPDKADTKRGPGY
jgi:multidrug efflux pump subunit AcrA (membrane-fusion protein)